MGQHSSRPILVQMRAYGKSVATGGRKIPKKRLLTRLNPLVAAYTKTYTDPVGPTQKPTQIRFGGPALGWLMGPCAVGFGVLVRVPGVFGVDLLVVT